MKKTLIIVAILIVLILVGIFLYNKLNVSISDDILHKVTFNEFKTKMENKDSFAIYVGHDSCSACQQYKPTLLSVVKKYNITLYYLDNSTLTEDENIELTSILSVQGTPTIAFITNGEEESTLNRIYGVTSKEDTIERFRLNGYIKDSN
ncbi:MAG TPA: thioredoxin family protein [Bacilli bacterium]|nr:thioredoxin family protein [Bacilli bacterium]